MRDKTWKEIIEEGVKKSETRIEETDGQEKVCWQGIHEASITLSQQVAGLYEENLATIKKEKRCRKLVKQILGIIDDTSGQTSLEMLGKIRELCFSYLTTEDRVPDDHEWRYVNLVGWPKMRGSYQVAVTRLYPGAKQGVLSTPKFVSVEEKTDWPTLGYAWRPWPKAPPTLKELKA